LNLKTAFGRRLTQIFADKNKHSQGRTLAAPASRVYFQSVFVTIQTKSKASPAESQRRREIIKQETVSLLSFFSKKVIQAVALSASPRLRAKTQLNLTD